MDKLAIGLVVTVFLAAALVGVALAQQDDWDQTISDQEGDADLVAVVDGYNVTKRDVRIPKEALQKGTAPLTATQAEQQAIVSAVIDRALQAEVARRELNPSEDELNVYIRRNREACEGPLGAECRTFIEGLGYTFEDYWVEVRSGYERDLGQANLYKDEVNKKGLTTESADSERVAVVETLLDTLRQQAAITWHDDDLKGAYEEATE